MDGNRVLTSFSAELEPAGCTCWRRGDASAGGRAHTHALEEAASALHSWGHAICSRVWPAARTVAPSLAGPIHCQRQA